MGKIRRVKKVHVVAITVFLALLLALVSVAAAAGGITLTPSSQASGGSVTVNGTGFGANVEVGVGLGAEVAGSETHMAYSGTGPGPYGGTLAHWPVKPGSFSLESDTTSGGGVITDYTDSGNGNLSSESPYFVAGMIDYATGKWSRTSMVDLTGIDQIYSANYTYYQYNVTSVGQGNTTGSGAFSASITVPNVASGTYTVTAVDSLGNMASATLTVTVIPEGLTVGVMLMVSSVAVIVSTRYFRKRPKIKNCS
jgi:hypothetical protein